jgi:hypothetical protein
LHASSAEPGTEVDHDGIRVRGREVTDAIVEHLRAQRLLADHVPGHIEVREVVVDLRDDLVRQCVAEYRTLSSARAHWVRNAVCARGVNSVTAIRIPANLLHCLLSSEERAVVGWRVNEVHCPE